MVKPNDIYDALMKPFEAKHIQWRAGKIIGGKAMALGYIDARQVMKRLDAVMGFDMWQCRHTVTEAGINICDIGLKLNDEWVWKSNGAGETNFEGEKGAFSGAFKRAAVVWGIGRYLYYLPKQYVAYANDKFTETPQLPKWAIPEEN